MSLNKMDVPRGTLIKLQKYFQKLEMVFNFGNWFFELGGLGGWVLMMGCRL